jgi:hypothetical protein
MKQLSLIIGFGAALALSGGADAHHSFAMFDLTKIVVMEGTVKELQWSQPHQWLQVMIPDGKGGADEWSLEVGIQARAENGWNRKALMPGDKVTVHVHPLRSGANGGEVMAVVLADGKTFGKVEDDRTPGSVTSGSQAGAEADLKRAGKF